MLYNINFYNNQKIYPLRFCEKEFLNKILHAYHMLISMQNYKILFNYL